MSQTVAVLGASHKPERYSNKAVRLLREYGHTVLPVAPGRTTLEGLPVYAALQDIPCAVDTLTMYVGPQRSEPLIPQICALAPQRVILNPGTESQVLEEALDQAGICWMHACTLVLLRTGQF